MTVNQISIPLLIGIPAAAYLLTHGDLRTAIIAACFTALGIVALQFNRHP